jgi:hypothetical protein
MQYSGKDRKRRMKRGQRELFPWNVESVAAGCIPVFGSGTVYLVVRVPTRREQIRIDLLAP